MGSKKKKEIRIFEQTMERNKNRQKDNGRLPVCSKEKGSKGNRGQKIVCKSSRRGFGEGGYTVAKTTKSKKR